MSLVHYGGFTGQRPFRASRFCSSALIRGVPFSFGVHKGTQEEKVGKKGTIGLQNAFIHSFHNGS